MPNGLSATIAAQAARGPQNFVMAAGEGTVLKVTIFDEDGNPLPLAGTTAVEWKLARTARSGAAILTKTLDDGISLIADQAGADEPNAGRLDVTLDPGETADLSGEYYHTCFVVTADGRTSQVFYGRPFFRPSPQPPA